MTAPKTVIPTNPFAAACVEGSALTYLALAGAGLEASFDPLPRDERGFFLAGLMFSAGSGDIARQAIHRMLAFGLEPAARCAVPERGHGFGGPRDELAAQGAPLASLAMGLRWDWAQALWKNLPVEKMLACAPDGLPLACAANNLEALAALAKAGADPNVRDAAGMPAMAHCRDPQALALLIEAGADLRTPFPQKDWSGNAHLLDKLLGEKSQTSEMKALRALAVDWAKAHPGAGETSSQTLAVAAFEALARGNKAAARSCVLALGVDAARHRDAQGASLLTAAVRAKNIPEANRLLGLGCDPFETLPTGDSPWGMMLGLLKAARASRSNWSERERIESALANIESKPKRRAIPWTSSDAPALAWSIAKECSCEDAAARLGAAFVAGLDPRAPWPNGLDASCFFAARAIGSAGSQNDINAREAFLKERPAAHSAGPSKAALTLAFVDWLAFGSASPKRSKDGDKIFGSLARSRADLLLDRLAQGPQAPADASERLESLAQLLFEGAAALGIQGVQLAPLQNNAVPASGAAYGPASKACSALARAAEVAALRQTASTAPKSTAKARL
jgi:hypothetical protein